MKAAPTQYKATCRRVPEVSPAPAPDWLSDFDIPRRWAGQQQFTLLDVSHCDWNEFLKLWQAWRADLHRPRLLHHATIIAPSVKRVLPQSFEPQSPGLEPLGACLEAALWGLLPGFHRLAFDDGQVLLTVCIGDVPAMLRQHMFAADAVWMDFDAPGAPSGIHALKALAACCRPGTQLVAQHPSATIEQQLMQCGFEGAAAAQRWRGEFNPKWRVKSNRSVAPSTPGQCLVVGAGLAGAAAAASLARRGWRVTVLDAAAAPASGASGLPAGILAPHISPDDNLLSRLSRAGTRITLQHAERLLAKGVDWSPTGVLERCFTRPRRLPTAWLGDDAVGAAAQHWVRPASVAQLSDCALAPDGDHAALWHARAGWIKPAQLVGAWLDTADVHWRGHSAVTGLSRNGQRWEAFGASGELMATADLVVLAAGIETAALLPSLRCPPLALQAIRGQVSWATHAADSARQCPVFPVNGHGHLLANLPLDVDDSQRAWLIGSSFERDSTTMARQLVDDEHNLRRLRALLPHCADLLTPTPSELRAWAGVRCATPTRLPAVGPVPNADGVWVCTGMGSRGLTFAGLCGELLAAQLHGEPWPVERRLADALAPAFGGH